MQTVTLSLPAIMTLDGYPAPEVSQHTDPDGQAHLIIEYNCDTPDQAVKTARAATRELVKFKQDKRVQGTRTGKKIMFVFNMKDGEIPVTWRGRAAGTTTSEGKAQILADIQAALKTQGTKANYFNSSVNQGLTVDQVPVELQFEFRRSEGDQHGACYAKLRAGKKEWTEYEITDADQAVELVARTRQLLIDL